MADPTPGIPIVYLDANVFIIAYEATGPAAAVAFSILEAVERGAIHGVTSELTLGEILPGPLGTGARDLAIVYDAIITDAQNLSVLPVTRDLLIASAELRAGRAGFRLQDALHCATARLANCRFFVSDDKRIPRDLGFETIRFGEHMVSEILATSR